MNSTISCTNRGALQIDEYDETRGFTLYVTDDLSIFFEIQTLKMDVK